MKTSRNGACSGSKCLLLMLLPTSPGNPSKALYSWTVQVRCPGETTQSFIFVSLENSHIDLLGSCVGGPVEPTGHLVPHACGII